MAADVVHLNQAADYEQVVCDLRSSTCKRRTSPTVRVIFPWNTAAMSQWTTFDLSAALSTLASLSLAFVLGALIGLERQVRQRTAGLRTNTLVAVGAAVFVDVAMRFYVLYGGSPSPMQVIAYVVSGIGFFGRRCHHERRL